MFDTNETAVFVEHEGHRHRVWLRRKLREGIFRPAVFCLKNPSTAGTIENAPTATRGINFAIAWGCSDLIFVNPVTIVATKADKIPVDADLVCPEANWALAEAARLATANQGYLIAAWGSPAGRAAVKRKMAIRFTQVAESGLPWQFLRWNDAGYPEHILYLPGELTPQRVAEFPARMPRPRSA